MFSFKKWLHKENLSGPGGGPEPFPDNQENLAKNMVAHGVGAFPSFDNLPKPNRTVSSRYVDSRFGKKFMSKSNNSKKYKESQIICALSNFAPSYEDIKKIQDISEKEYISICKKVNKKIIK